MSAEAEEVRGENASGTDALNHTPHPPGGTVTPDAVVPPYRLLDSSEVILEELSKLYYESRYTKRMQSARATKLTFVLGKAQELVNARDTLRELRLLREKLERLEAATPGLVPPLLPAPIDGAEVKQ